MRKEIVTNNKIIFFPTKEFIENGLVDIESTD